MRISRRSKIATAAMAAVLLAGCSSGGGEPAASSGSGDQPVELTWFMWSGSDVEKNAWIKVGDMVTAKYPNITIKFETTPFNDFWTKLTTQAAGGGSACIVGLQGQRAPQFGSFLLPLEDYMAKEGVNAADYVPSITEGLKYEGQQVAIPYDVGPYVMFYNKDAFKAAGVKEPAIGWTTADFMDAAKKLTKAPKYGYFARSDIGDLMPWVLSESGRAAVNDQGALDVNNAEWKAGAEWYTRLITEEKVAAQVPSANSSNAAANQFLSGNAYMAPDGPWSLINTRALAKFEVGIAPMPAGAAGSKTWSDGSGFGITQSCKNPDEAFKAISVITGAEAETYLAEEGRAYPALISTQQAWYTGNKTEDVKPVMDYALQNSVPFKTTSTWQQVNTAFAKQAVATYNGQGTVEELLSQAQAQGDS